ncbi:hypothetical protein LSH36_824g01022 [Paralvinella palmiformis]|uniref:PNPLA domain-containing protein n=1 Tax=Paralvinella palmiformis TaxID=53620 RepID=A0AAD9IZV4_9ANNE|nr:hypothetical protein LSH36_824g01022 [Paralvinella palmiformis]
MSFSGCGFLGIYHLGVVQTLTQHGRKLLMNVHRFGGASAGSLIAAALATRKLDHHMIKQCMKFCYDLAAESRNTKGGVLSPGMSLLRPVRVFLNKVLPDNAHIIAKDRLFVSVTDFCTNKNKLICQFKSKKHLIKCLCSSSLIPYLTGKECIFIGKKTIMLRAFDRLVRPQHRDVVGTRRLVHLNGEEFDMTVNNLKRIWHSLFPPSRDGLKKYFLTGRHDCIRFLKQEGLYEDNAPTDPEDGAPEDDCCDEYGEGPSCKEHLYRESEHANASYAKPGIYETEGLGEVKDVKKKREDKKGETKEKVVKKRMPDKKGKDDKKVERGKKRDKNEKVDKKENEKSKPVKKERYEKKEKDDKKEEPDKKVKQVKKVKRNIKEKEDGKEKDDKKEKQDKRETHEKKQRHGKRENREKREKRQKEKQDKEDTDEVGENHERKERQAKKVKRARKERPHEKQGQERGRPGQERGRPGQERGPGIKIENIAAVRNGLRNKDDKKKINDHEEKER